ncbi:MAG TPA: DUF5916 domain-containing protein [Acidobacteriota bacterium]|nr:DUF5916 domain-containing protein [Acidobacteriota bacterium]
MWYRAVLLLTVTLTLVQISAMTGPVLADETFTAVYHPTIRVPRGDGEIRVDGELDEMIWRQAARATGFVETNPGDQIKPGVRSEALITYDQSNLYVALIAWDDPSEIRASMRERDAIFSDDYFGIMLDTYGDQAWAYEFFVNPLGLQGDLRMLASGNEDISLDVVFNSYGKVTDSGYQVELAIPFASLRFPNRPVQTWRANFWRDRQRENRYRYCWAAQDRNDPCFICQWGYLTGIEGIEPSSNIEILPNVIGYQSGALADSDDPASVFDNADPDAELALNARYGISSNSSVEIAVNPDFSQVESDAGQIDVNNPFGLWFPERRPFFQEGSDLFSTFIDAIYSRSVNDPIVAGKFTGQYGRTSLAYLVARDENSPLLLPFAEQSILAQAGFSTVNIFRIRQTFGQNSYIGAMATDRRLSTFSRGGVGGGSGSGSTYGMDAAWRFLTNYRLEFQVLGSHTVEPQAPDLIDTTWADGRAQESFDRGRHTVALDGEVYDGHAVYAGFERSARHWDVDLHYAEFSPTFRTDNGFTTRNDLRRAMCGVGVGFRPNREWLISWWSELDVARIWDHGGPINLDPFSFVEGNRDEWITVEMGCELRNRTQLSVSYLNSQERFAGSVFPGISRLFLAVDSRPGELIISGLNYTVGRSICRDRRSPELGWINDVNAFVTVKPTQRLLINQNLSFSRMEHLDRFLQAHPGVGRKIYSGYILRTRLTYHFTRKWNLRLVAQYDDFDERFDLEPLLTWRLNPFTIFYVGVNNRLQHFDPDKYTSVSDSQWETSSRQFFAKLQYLFRI